VVERTYLRTLDGLIFNSRTTREVVRGVAGGLSPHTIAYPAGDRLQPNIGPAEIRARAAQPGPLRLLFLGNLIPRKGLHVLLEALRSLPPETWALTVAGSLEMDASYAHAMVRRAVDFGLASRVEFVGPLVEAAVAQAFRTHHVLVVPSLYEGYGIVYLEGMGFGLPAVGTTAGAAREIITSGQDGYLVLPGDHQALAGSLDGLARDRDRLAKMGETALKRFLQHPTWDQTGAQIRNFLHSFAQG
jgi:glycosyltransferase involved in cell wall biosynthesis